MARLAWRATLVTLSFWVFSSSTRWFAPLTTTPNGPFLPGTVLLLAIGVLLVLTWDGGDRVRATGVGERPWLDAHGG